MLHIQDGSAQEREKYAEIWEFDEYRKFSPGDESAKKFLEVLKPAPCSLVVDIGCGQGNAGVDLAKAGMTMSWLDITDSALVADVPRDRFMRRPIWEDWAKGRVWNYGFCVDVLEHIPPEYTMLCVSRIVEACGTSWLQIANLPDTFGEKIGETLHLTVRPFSWWLIRLATIGNVVDARDLCGRSLFIVERK